jgi:hypothetical protein
VESNFLFRIWQKWERFWWAEVDGRSVLATRILFGISALGVSCLRFWNMDFYNEKSLALKSEALGLMGSSIQPLWTWTFWPDSWALVMQIILTLLLLAFTVGWIRRPFIFLAWVIHMGFMQRNFAASMGVDSMIMVFLFYLSFVEVWKKTNYDGLSRVMIRMIQVHMAIIYCYTGLEKLRGSSWWEGSALWLVFNNTQISLFDLTWIAHFPVLLALLAHSTVIFELFFPAFVMNPKTKFYWLGLGVFFHVGIAVTLDLWGFSGLMLSQYFLYMRTSDWDHLQNWFKRRKVVLF